MSDDPVLNGQPISGLKVVELRKELECRGLSKSGVKKDLFERLRDHLNRVGPENDRPIDFEADDEPAAPRATRASLSPRKGASPTKQPSPGMNKFVAQYLQNQQATLQEHRREVAPEGPTEVAAQPSSSSEEAPEVSSTTMPEEVKSPAKPKGSPKKQPVEEVPPPAAVPLDEVELAHKKKAESQEEPTSSTPEADQTTQLAKEEAAPISVESTEKAAEKPAATVEAQIPPTPEQPADEKEAVAPPPEVEVEKKAENPAEAPKAAEVPKSPEKSSPSKAKKADGSPMKAEKSAAPIAHEISPPPAERPPSKPDSQPEVGDEKPLVEEAPKKEEEPVRKRPKIVFDLETKPAPVKPARASPTTPATPTAEKTAASRRKITPPTGQASSESTVDAVPRAAAGLPPKSNERQNSVGMVQPRAPSPARHDPTEFLHISGLKRPYTIENLQTMLGQFGEFAHDEDFWIDKKLRSNCIVKYDSIEVARKAREELHGSGWPNAGDRLKVEYTTEEMLLRRQRDDPSDPAKKTSVQEAPAAASRLVIHVQNDRRSSLTASSRKRERSAERSRASQDSDWDKSAATPPRKDYDLDNLFKKTKALPHIYYLPLTDEEAEKRKVERIARNGDRDRADASKPSTSFQRRRSPSPRRSPPRRRPVRSRSRSPVRDRDRRRSPPRRRVSRSRSPVRRRR